MPVGPLTSRGLTTTPKPSLLPRAHFERNGAQHGELEILEAAWTQFIESRPA